MTSQATKKMGVILSAVAETIEAAEGHAIHLDVMKVVEEKLRAQQEASTNG